MKYTFFIRNLDCASCAMELENELKKIEGVREVSIRFLTQKLILECDEKEKIEILKKVKKIIHKKEVDVTIEEDERYE